MDPEVLADWKARLVDLMRDLYAMVPTFEAATEILVDVFGIDPSMVSESLHQVANAVSPEPTPASYTVGRIDPDGVGRPLVGSRRPWACPQSTFA